MKGRLIFGNSIFKIEECPFCHGLEFEIESNEGCQHNYVVCKGCLTEGPIDTKSYTTSIERAVELWNKR